MKKKLRFIMLLGISLCHGGAGLCHGGVAAESRVCSPAVEAEMRSLHLDTPVEVIKIPDQCTEITNMQKVYRELKNNAFLSFYPEFKYDYIARKGYRLNPEGWKIFHDFSAQSPRNLTEKMLFPYGNEQYAKRGEGVYLCKMGDGIWQSGVRQAEGRLVLETETITDFDFAEERCRKYYEGDLDPQERIKVYFEIEKSPQDLQQLPYVKQHGHLQRVFLGCVGDIDTRKYLRNIEMLGALRHYYDFQAQEHSYHHHRSSQKDKDPYTSTPKSSMWNIDILPYLNQDITMKFYLLPNYLPAAGDNFSECANSWLDAYEIVGV